MKRSLATGLAATAAAVVLMGCGAGGEEGGQEEPDLVMRDFAFEPTDVTVTSGEASLRVVNEDDAQHNITMEEFGVNEDLSGGDGSLVEFTADTPGDFAFFCAFHPEQMVGQLTVE